MSRQVILIRVRFSEGKAPEGIYAGLKPKGSRSERGKTGADQVAAEVSDHIHTTFMQTVRSRNPYTATAIRVPF